MIAGLLLMIVSAGCSRTEREASGGDVPGESRVPCTIEGGDDAVIYDHDRSLAELAHRLEAYRLTVHVER